jgi:glutamate racemase
MQIGIFDSGVGGLIIAKAIMKKLPEYSYVYLGDTKRVPYGNKSPKEVHQFLKEGIEYLLREKNCALVIVACNTASAEALRKIQQEYLPKHFPERRVLGVIIPAAEAVRKAKRIGIIATTGTVNSKTYPAEIYKLNPKAEVYQEDAPLLVPAIEHDKKKNIEMLLEKYLAPLLAKNIDTLILGCTHYPILKKEIKKLLPKKVRVISQDEIIPERVKWYLHKHPEIKKSLSKEGCKEILVTKKTPTILSLSKKWFGKNGAVSEVKI